MSSEVVETERLCVCVCVCVCVRERERERERERLIDSPLIVSDSAAVLMSQIWWVRAAKLVAVSNHQVCISCVCFQDVLLCVNLIPRCKNTQIQVKVLHSKLK